MRKRLIRQFQTQLLLQSLIPIPHRNLSNPSSLSDVLLRLLLITLQTSNIQRSRSQTHRVFPRRSPFQPGFPQNLNSHPLSLARDTRFLSNLRHIRQRISNRHMDIKLTKQQPVTASNILLVNETCLSDFTKRPRSSATTTSRIKSRSRYGSD